MSTVLLIKSFAMQSINLSALFKLFKISLVFAAPYVFIFAGICSFNFLEAISAKSNSVTGGYFLKDLALIVGVLMDSFSRSIRLG
jgi:hypothetical protein